MYETQRIIIIIIIKLIVFLYILLNIVQRHPDRVSIVSVFERESAMVLIT